MLRTGSGWLGCCRGRQPPPGSTKCSVEGGGGTRVRLRTRVRGRQRARPRRQERWGWAPPDSSPAPSQTASGPLRRCPLPPGWGLAATTSAPDTCNSGSPSSGVKSWDSESGDRTGGHRTCSKRNRGTANRGTPYLFPSWPGCPTASTHCLRTSCMPEHIPPPELTTNQPKCYGPSAESMSRFCGSRRSPLDPRTHNVRVAAIAYSIPARSPTRAKGEMGMVSPDCMSPD